MFNKGKSTAKGCAGQLVAMGGNSSVFVRKKWLKQLVCMFNKITTKKSGRLYSPKSRRTNK